MSTSETDPRYWPGHDAIAPHGERIRMLDEIYADPETGAPTFGVVKMGPIGETLRLVPLDGAWLHDDHVHVAHGKQAVESSPEIEPDGELSEESERRLRQHHDEATATAIDDPNTEVVEREVLIREPTGHQTFERDSVIKPVVVDD